MKARLEYCSLLKKNLFPPYIKDAIGGFSPIPYALILLHNCIPFFHFPLTPHLKTMLAGGETPPHTRTPGLGSAITAIGWNRLEKSKLPLIF